MFLAADLPGRQERHVVRRLFPGVMQATLGLAFIPRVLYPLRQLLAVRETASTDKFRQALSPVLHSRYVAEPLGHPTVGKCVNYVLKNEASLQLSRQGFLKINTAGLLTHCGTKTANF